METQSAVEIVKAVLSWFGGGVFVLLATLKIGDLIVKSFERFWVKKDAKNELHETNTGKQIEADSLFTQSLIQRIERLEEKLSEMQGKYTEQAVENERVKAENKSLKDTNERQQGELKGLHNENEGLRKQIVNLENQLKRQQMDIVDNKKAFDELKREFERLK